MCLSNLYMENARTSWPWASGMTARELLADEAPGQSGEAYLSALTKHVKHDENGTWITSGEYGGLSFVAAFFDLFGFDIPIFEETGCDIKCISGNAFPNVDGKTVRVALIKSGAHYDAFIDRSVILRPSLHVSEIGFYDSFPRKDKNGAAFPPILKLTPVRARPACTAAAHAQPTETQTLSLPRISHVIKAMSTDVYTHRCSLITSLYTHFNCTHASFARVATDARAPGRVDDHDYHRCD